uniref:Putative ovule protein n=1 Tax=Solanum chacoense TaxID=4108 RepID=A0A0V0H8I3_SOLCH
MLSSNTISTNIAGLSLPFFGGVWGKENGKRITISTGKLAKNLTVAPHVKIGGMKLGIGPSFFSVFLVLPITSKLLLLTWNPSSCQKTAMAMRLLFHYLT